MDGLEWHRDMEGPFLLSAMECWRSEKGSNWTAFFLLRFFSFSNSFHFSFSSWDELDRLLGLELGHEKTMRGS